MEREKSSFENASVAECYRRYLEPVIFQPFASLLVGGLAPSAGSSVLDVASGTGVVARTAARAVGTGGRVVASDLSPAMLAEIDLKEAPDSARIETLVSPATELDLPAGTFDFLFCQQGFPFVSDRPAAAAEFARVLRPAGRAAVSVWRSGGRLDPFETYAETMESAGLDPPFPNGYDMAPLTMTSGDLDEAFTGGGFEVVDVATETLELDWPSPQVAAEAITGTPYGQTLSRLASDEVDAIYERLVERMTAPDGSAVRQVMTTLVAYATAPSS